MWLAIFGTVGVLGILSVFFLIAQFHRFRCFQKLAEKHKFLSWLLAAVPVAVLGCTGFISLFAMFTVLIHLMVIWLVCLIAAAVIRKCLHRERTRNYAGGAALLITAAVLGAGWFFAHHVFETDYRIETEKSLNGEPLRIVMFADSHLGTTLDGAEFAEQVTRMQAANPDIVCICGDFVDDETKKEDMLTACRALGTLQTRCGVFYCYGNHDEGYYHYRDFSGAELKAALEENHVTVLADETYLTDAGAALIGRLDAYMTRQPVSALTDPLDDGSYQIVLDHQPNDYDAEAASGADLVLSGHTHGGHIWPAGLIGLLIGANDRVYGTEQRGNTTFIVTSGISGWAIPFKTGTISEYCVIDVIPKTANAT